MTHRRATAPAYETVIGLEVHAQILTRSKMFCGCSADYADAPPNTHVCPVCMALPGALPVVNRIAVEKAILAGLALNCMIPDTAVFARKNYHYADLPKGYQISQFELPLCREGWLEIETAAGRRRIGITRAHLEEDTGKLMHVAADSEGARLSEGRRGYTLVDLNRAGVPLLEIVTEPDLRSPEEARAYLTQLQQILRYLDVSSADMEKGAMRCEANVSVRPAGQERFGTKVEVKNLNSFRSVRLALEFEVARQIALYECGERVVQVTMGWDEAHGRTVVQRVKESAHDYRYFPEPDLPPLSVGRSWVAGLRAGLPELPDARAKRFVSGYGLEARDAAVLAADRRVADYFEEATAAYARQLAHASLNAETGKAAKTVAHWVTGELFRLMNEAAAGFESVPVAADDLAELLGMVAAGEINPNSAKRALDIMFESGAMASGALGQTAGARRRVADVVMELGLTQVSDSDLLAAAVAEVVARHPEEVAKFRTGKESIFGWLMGQVMRETNGKANPAIVRELLQKALRSEQTTQE